MMNREATFTGLRRMRGRAPWAGDIDHWRLADFFDTHRYIQHNGPRLEIEMMSRLSVKIAHHHLDILAPTRKR